MAASVEDHVAAVKVLLAGLPALQVTVYDGEVPKTAAQMYAVLYTPPGDVSRGSLRAVSDQFRMVVQVTCVGISAAQARRVVGLVRDALVDQVPVVAGRTCWPIVQEEGTPSIQRDDTDRDPTTGQSRMYFTPRFIVASTV